MGELAVAKQSNEFKARFAEPSSPEPEIPSKNLFPNLYSSMTEATTKRTGSGRDLWRLTATSRQGKLEGNFALL
jgi:hypothetical protein